MERKKMYGQEFVEILRNPPAEFVILSGEDETIQFENITFEHIQINESIESERRIQFKNVQFNSVTIKGVRTTKAIVFWNVDSKNSSFNHIEVDAERLIFDGTGKFEGKLDIVNCNLEILLFSDIHFGYHVTVSKCNIHRAVLFANFNSLFFEENKISQIAAKGGEINELHFLSGNTGYISVYGLIKLKEVFITGGDIQTIQINSEGLEKLEIKNETSKQPNLRVDTVEFFRTGKNHISTITNLLLKKLQFKEGLTSKESIIRVYSMTLGDLEFSNFINYGQINLTNVNISNSVSFASSDVGKLSFIACTLEKASLDFSKSKIIETFIIGSEFPTKFKEGNNEEDKVEAYGQIKKIYESRGAQKNALEYYSLEMNALANTDAVKANLWEKVNLWLNRFSTNHGVSWKRGFISTLAVSLGLYALYIWSLSVYIFNPRGVENWNELWKVLSYYFEFVNPAHRTDIIATELGIPSPSSASRVVEGFSRIAIAYFIYQLIQAFRKHGKK